MFLSQNPISLWILGAGWQNQGYACYVVTRTYTEKVGLIDWRIGKRKKEKGKRGKKRKKEREEGMFFFLAGFLKAQGGCKRWNDICNWKMSDSKKVGLIALEKGVTRTYRFFCHPDYNHHHNCQYQHSSWKEGCFFYIIWKKNSQCLVKNFLCVKHPWCEYLTAAFFLPGQQILHH